MSTPTIYAACLTAYNHGILHGEWIAATDINRLHNAVTDMLKNSPIPEAKEPAIHDHEGFYDIKISEHESLETIATLAELIEEHGQAFADYYEYVSLDLDEAAATFDEAYMGQYENLEDFALQQFEELYGPVDYPGFRIEVDLTAWACDYWAGDAGHIFRHL